MSTRIMSAVVDANRIALADRRHGNIKRTDIVQDGDGDVEGGAVSYRTDW